ncbi:MAG: DUF6531 domain-containing protein [Burkholderiaceae bacterium]|jgi:RHS repeat-associated protein|nr:DUF6531 domain-containing protein [Burkholderiaceae bacterium]
MLDKLVLLESYTALCKSLITPESLVVLTNSRGGIPCCAHPGSVTVDSFVNPQLGALVLLGQEELDFTLPGALPVIWQRRYSSHVSAAHESACGLLGHGWHLPLEVSLELRADCVLLFDATGRVITFSQPLRPGEQRYSPSEDTWLLRGGKDTHGYLPAWSRQPRFAKISAELAADEHHIFVSSGGGIFSVFTPVAVTQDNASKAADTAAGKNHNDPSHQHHDHADDTHAHQHDASPVAQRWRLALRIDRFGRSQHYQYSEGHESDKRYYAWRDSDTPLPAGRPTVLTDGVGRRYRLYHQRIHAGRQAQAPWGADDGWRLAGVELEHDPLHFAPDPVFLVRYGYNRQGQLATVHDRSGELVREFEWHDHRISGQRHCSGPWRRYRYDGVEPEVKVAESTHEQSLSYRFEYQHLPPSPIGTPANATVVTDSFKRRQIYHCEGWGGLNRLTAHHRADGSVMRYQYDESGRLVAHIDPLERKTSTRFDMQGNIIEVQQPGKNHCVRNYDQTGCITISYGPTGAATRYENDDWGRRTQVTHADGRVERYHYPDPKEQAFTCDLPTQIEDAHSGTHHLQYNDAGLLLGYTDRSGHSTQWEYDRWGNVTEETDPLGNTTQYEHDHAGRVIAARLPNSQTRRYQYDHQGNLTRVQPDENIPDSLLQISRDPLGRIVQISLGEFALQMSRDEAGRLIALTNENGAQSRFAWDVMDRLIQETGFDGRVQRYQWDAAGQLTQTSGDGATQTTQAEIDLEQDTIHYLWSTTGRLIERQLPATQASERQSQRYEWDQAGQLKAASVYLITQEQEQIEERLQSRIEIERDGLGRIIGELQRLYKTQDAATPHAAPPIEYEHRITHTFDPSGDRQESELQNVGQIQWRLDNLGQIQSLMHNGHDLIDFERNALCQEIKRQWHTLQSSQSTENLAPALLTRINQWDNMGRLQDTQLDALPLQAADSVPRELVDQIVRRQYLYDPLGQLIAIRTPAQILRYGYDAAGRLRAQADSLTPEVTQRWDIDPAGNRLPGQMPTPQQRQNWAELLHHHLRWQDPAFNLLTQDVSIAQHQDSIDKWLSNRVGFHQDCAWRYDAQGNRVEQIRQTADGQHNRQRLFYDGDNQLTAVHIENIDAQGNITESRESRYTYDALGRRLKKAIRDGKHEHLTYYGWDSHRLVHTEQMKEDGTRDIVQTIYEPNSLIPLIRLSTTADGAPEAKPHLLVQSIKAAMPKDQRNQLGLDHTLVMVQNIVTEIPELMQKKLENTLQEVFQSSRTGKGDALSGIAKVHRTNAMIAEISQKMEASLQKITSTQGEAMKGHAMPSILQKTSDIIASMRDGLEEMKQDAQGPVTIHYYLCNHFGIPTALIDQKENIVWAAKFDPWGNIEEEFNPHNIDQPIRLPGQYIDSETGLHYDGDKYYDPKIGAYIAQNSTDVGEANKYSQSLGHGSEATSFGPLNFSFIPKNVLSNLMKVKEIANFNPFRFIRTLPDVIGNEAEFRLPRTKQLYEMHENEPSNNSD